MAQTPLILLGLLLLAASAWDITARRIPNALAAAGVLAGLVWHGWHGSVSGLLEPLAGIAVALLGLALYAARVLGAGDVKLFMAVGALMGPAFLLWTLLGSLGAGGLFALAWTLRRGTLLPAGGLRLVPVSKTARMPFAPAIALGAAWAAVHLHLIL